VAKVSGDNKSAMDLLENVCEGSGYALNTCIEQSDYQHNQCYSLLLDLILIRVALT
jgi:hypothetical protein